VCRSFTQVLSRVFFVVCFACAPAFAGTWSGYLVDASCYKIRLQDTNPTNADDYVNRDRGLLVELCRPTNKTKQFTVVQEDGLFFNLDPSGDAQAAQLVQSLPTPTKKKKSAYLSVVVKGNQSGQTVKVSSISLDK
jgi:hypothetical protein